MEFTRRGLLDAILVDHPCTEQSCDIAAAAAAGYVHSAAYLLMGATETPNVVSYFKATGFKPTAEDGWPWDWDDWKAHHDRYGVECIACNAFNYGDDNYRPEQCGNCLAPLEGS